ncbi:sugar transferase [Candidatus Mycobacterium methanotrophicum]|uniref:Sugar transferase n=1 Tax=Candidatus Mycobacterium methanotrophicum TaxID=2943498 RepID=A0ABY4QSN1_9MYCO|nr:sugar transferase [Candidatus Mycobacterium methanotrophicum]UQX12975.1 sugar transferase [Candidatus Mycobacterium methanotrophicum]
MRPAPTYNANTAPRWHHQYSRRLRITDSLIVCGSVALAQYIRFGDSPYTSGYRGEVMTLFSVLFAALWLSSIAMFHARSIRVIGAGIEEYRRIVSASVWTFGIIAMATLLARIFLARGYLAVALPVGTLGLLVSRRLWRSYIAGKRAHGKCQTRVLAIGDRKGVSQLAQELTRNPRDGYVVVGAGIPGYGPSRDKTLLVHGREIPILGDETHALAAISRSGADTVALTGAERFGAQGIRQLMWRLETMDVDLVVAPGVMDVAEGRLTLRPVAGFPLLHVEKPQYEGAKCFQKRAFDFCFALAALIGTSPLLIASAIAIKLTSKGPVFYPSERIGLDGKPFTMIKFRTMAQDADSQIESVLHLNESQGGMLFKIRDDPRITTVGRILRRFSIDELPQFLNVLKQDMSVVGPRPPLRREVVKYNGDVKRRLLVKPGITGLWQVNGRSDLPWDESVRLDLSYVDNWSMANDLLLIAKTLKAVVVSDGAY